MDKRSKDNFKASLNVKKRVSEGVDANAFRKPRQATKLSKEALKKGKKNLRVSRKNYRKLKAGEGLQVIAAKKKYLEAKTTKKVSKKVFKQAKKTDPTRVVNKAKGYAKNEIKQTSVNHMVLSPLSKDDTLREGTDLYRKVQRTKSGFKLSKDVVTSSAKASVNLSKHTYGLANRSYNMARGRGFARTPKDFTLRKQAAKKFRNFSNKISTARKAKKAEHGLNLIRQIFKGQISMSRAMTVAATSPVLIVVVLVIILVSLLGVLNIESSVPTKQDDFQLTKSWTYLTKLDAEHTDTTNTFYTPLDDIMYYMNDQFEDYNLSDHVTIGENKAAKANQTYEEYLNGLWDAMNGSSPDYKLTTMEKLETDKDSVYALSSDDYKDLQERVKEVGYSTLDGQLQFPYETDSLVVNHRYGYERNGDNTELHASIDVSSTQGQNLLSPMHGIINSVTSSNKLVISQANNSRLTLTGVDSGRFIGGETVDEGTLLGKATGASLNIVYEKYNEDDDKWEKVNPAFYFSKVTYTQFTSLSTDDFDPGKTMSERAEKVYNQLTKLGFKREGICAILGNWSVESSINPKRAEGDYLSPPVGASSTSWDDPKWLAMGGLDIYGKFPNILHRGLGLGQWTDTSDGGTRHTLLLNYAKDKKKKWYDLSLQIDFALNGDSAANQTKFKNTAGNVVASTIPELTNYFLVNWEGNSGDKLAQRVQAAQNWYNYFTSSSSDDMNASSKEIFKKYKDKIKPLPTNKETKEGQGWPGNGYAVGNCTWYVYNRQAQIGHNINGFMGNGGEWGNNYSKTPGATIDSKPRVGDAVSFSPGVAGSSPLYGHVAQVEVVNPDGTFVVSEMNIQGLYSMGYRVFKPGAGMTFIHFK